MQGERKPFVQSDIQFAQWVSHLYWKIGNEAKDDGTLKMKAHGLKVDYELVLKDDAI